MGRFSHLINKNFVKFHILLIGLGIAIGLLIGNYLAFSETGSPFDLVSYAMLISGVVGIAMVYLNYYLSVLFDRIIAWHRSPGLRFIIGLTIEFGLTLVSIWFLTGWLVPLFDLSAEVQTLNFDLIIIKVMILVFILVLMYDTIYFALYSYHHYAKVHIATVQQERRQLELQFEALKSQLSPHFLFNSLNTISSLVYEDHTRAESFIRRMAKAYQYTLKSYTRRWVTLKEEVEFAKSFYFLLETRFANHFELTIDLPEKLLQTRIPPLTLQLLIENAVKHNQVDKEHRLQVDIKLDSKGWISVKNNKTVAPPKRTSFRIGLNNIRERYDLLTHREIQVLDSNQFEVKIPVIR